MSSLLDFGIYVIGMWIGCFFDQFVWMYVYGIGVIYYVGVVFYYLYFMVGLVQGVDGGGWYLFFYFQVGGDIVLGVVQQLVWCIDSCLQVLFEQYMMCEDCCLCLWLFFFVYGVVGQGVVIVEVCQ